MINFKNTSFVLLLFFILNSNIYSFTNKNQALFDAIHILNTQQETSKQLKKIKKIAARHHLDLNCVINNLKKYIDDELKYNEKRLNNKFDYGSLKKGAICGLIGLIGLKVTHYFYASFKQQELEAQQIYNSTANQIVQNQENISRLNRLTRPQNIPRLEDSPEFFLNIIQHCLKLKEALLIHNKLDNSLFHIKSKISEAKKCGVISGLFGNFISLSTLGLSSKLFYDSINPQFKEKYKNLNLLKEKVNKLSLEETVR